MKISTTESRSFDDFSDTIPAMQLNKVLDGIKADGIVFDNSETLKDEKGRITRFTGSLKKFNWGEEECKDYTIIFTVLYKGDDAVEETMLEQFFSLNGKERFETRKVRYSFKTKMGWMNYYTDDNTVTDTELFAKYNG